MDSGALAGLFEQTLLTLLATAGPVLIAALGVGLVVSVFQAATQINEATLTFLPKLLVTALIMIVGGQWMLGQLTGFTRAIFTMIATVAR